LGTVAPAAGIPGAVARAPVAAVAPSAQVAAAAVAPKAATVAPSAQVEAATVTPAAVSQAGAATVATSAPALGEASTEASSATVPETAPSTVSLEPSGIMGVVPVTAVPQKGQQEQRVNVDNGTNSSRESAWSWMGFFMVILLLFCICLGGHDAVAYFQHKDRWMRPRGQEDFPDRLLLAPASFETRPTGTGIASATEVLQTATDSRGTKYFRLHPIRKASTTSRPLLVDQDCTGAKQKALDRQDLKNAQKASVSASKMAPESTIPEPEGALSDNTCLSERLS
jgi:hypothetical protein